jgi:hypothetical protein
MFACLLDCGFAGSATCVASTQFREPSFLFFDPPCTSQLSTGLMIDKAGTEKTWD